MKTLRLVISGRVQGVGYRDWMVAEAQARGIRGWVRNIGGAQVEALVQGEDQDVDSLVAACRAGPSYAQVSDVAASATEAPPMTGFERRRSA